MERPSVLDAFLSSKRFSRGTCSDVKNEEQVETYREGERDGTKGAKGWNPWL